VIYEHALGIAENAIAPNGSVAMRISNDEFCKHLIKRFRKPIVSTSANISGEPEPAVFPDISDVIKQRVDYVVEHRRDDVSTKLPSAIIRWENGEIVRLR
jgi:L-threonylcarbamoyladenylate synthase